MRQDRHAACLVHEVERAAVEGELLVRGLGPTGQEHDRQRDAGAAQARQQVDARHAGQTPVEQDDVRLGTVGECREKGGAIAERRDVEAVVGELAAYGLPVIVVVLDERNPDPLVHVAVSVGIERGIGVGPGRDAFLHLCCHRSLPRTQEFRTAWSGRPGRAGHPGCTARRGSAIVCLADDPPRLWERRAIPGARSRSCRRVKPQWRSTGGEPVRQGDRLRCWPRVRENWAQPSWPWPRRGADATRAPPPRYAAGTWAG